MSLPLAIAVYWICWWLVLLMVLPFGIRTQQEAGAVVPGTIESAPAVPRLLARLVATTVLATVIFAVVYSVIEYRLVKLDDFPLLPVFEEASGSR